MRAMHKLVRRYRLLDFVLIITIVIIMLGVYVVADLNVRSGRSYYAELEASSDTVRWAGAKILNNAVQLTESSSPFTSYLFNTAYILQLTFPGYNLNDGDHYYAAMQQGTFSLNSLLNVSVTDLLNGGLFDSTYFPNFYPNYDTYNDNPYETWCCNQTNISIGGVNYTAYVITLEEDVQYYLLKHNSSDNITPIFLSEFDDATCYNSTACVAQFMLPVSDSIYNFYVLNKYPTYTLDVWIDGVSTTAFAQTALPYNLTVRATETYTGNPAYNLSVFAAEDSGQNIFIPYRMDGYISRAYSIGMTDETDAMETFLVAPTVYPSLDNYSIMVGVLEGETPTNIKTLSITQKDTLVAQSKSLSPSTLFDNAKASVNAMNQINSYLFSWSNALIPQAKRFRIDYFLNNASFSVYSIYNSTPGIMQLKTGAPNVINVYVFNGAVQQSGYLVKVKEQGGYLIMNPYTGDDPLTEKTRQDLWTVPTGATEFIVTPTSLGVISSNITFDILDSNEVFVDSYTAEVDSTLNIVTGGTPYSNDLLKTIVNSMNQVLNSLYYALNY
ncbi:hypothetical protein JW868_04065 [Candidatus Woesearchaeota archaeon]|nr:hypothetical protein [Candidatus Woesearchaeota archaeon]